MSTLLDEDTVVLESLDFEPDCELVEYPHPAQVSVTLRCCAAVALACDSHIEAARAGFGRFTRRGATCLQCNHRYPPDVVWEDIYIVRPLGGAS